jgi:hypothetical protein
MYWAREMSLTGLEYLKTTIQGGWRSLSILPGQFHQCPIILLLAYSCRAF